jgi:thiaminase (transcriptional activator TenA)
MLHEIIWQRNVRLAEVCLHHPFVRGLADGTLDPEAFRRYVVQDGFFLNAFARAYALAAAGSQDGETLISLCIAGTRARRCAERGSRSPRLTLRSGTARL